MLYALYSLKKKYLNKKIYIWNINRDSVDLFTMLAFRRIDVQGFITSHEEYAGETYMNRPILSLKHIRGKDEDSIIFVSDEVSKDKISMLPDDKVVYWSDAVGLNEELRHKKIIIYGIGDGADKLYDKLSKEEIGVELYCVTKRNNTAEYRGKKVIGADELKNYENCAVIISVITFQYRLEIMETLSDFSGQVYAERIFMAERGIHYIKHINLVQNIDYAIKENRKIFLYSKRDQLSELIEDVLNIYDIRIDGYVYDVENKEKNIKNIYELSYEGEEDKLIIINEEFPERLIKARENVELAGFSLEKRNYTSIQGYTRANQVLLSKLPYSRDPLTGYSIMYPQGKPGWKMYGEEKEDNINIMVLGNSTSAEVYHPENWISKLYYKLKQNNITTTIYNGAHESNGIVEEVLRLLRDGPVLKPQIVISLSGVNDIVYSKCANQFNVQALIDWTKASSGGKHCSGVCSSESLYSFWSRNMGILKLVSEFYGANFFGFLQPFNISMEHMTVQEKSLYEKESSIEGAKEFKNSASSNEDYINLINLFDHQDEMYFDVCHYTGKAHETIANKIFETILPVIQAI